jgi:hypothetical protein
LAGSNGHGAGTKITVPLPPGGSNDDPETS